MEARDSLPARLRKSVIATVNVQVIFDSPPEFSEDSYETTIRETLRVGSTVYSEIEASDPDTFAVSYYHSQ